jgi:hypothetical protein
MTVTQFEARMMGCLSGIVFRSSDLTMVWTNAGTTVRCLVEHGYLKVDVKQRREVSGAILFNCLCYMYKTDDRDISDCNRMPSVCTRKLEVDFCVLQLGPARMTP